jgi:hypothetical protein
LTERYQVGQLGRAERARRCAAMPMRCAATPMLGEFSCGGEAPARSQPAGPQPVPARPGAGRALQRVLRRGHTVAGSEPRFVARVAASGSRDGSAFGHGARWSPWGSAAKVRAARAAGLPWTVLLSLRLPRTLRALRAHRLVRCCGLG